MSTENFESESIENIEENNPAEDFEAVSGVMKILSGLSEPSRMRVMQTISTFFNFQPMGNLNSSYVQPQRSNNSFSSVQSNVGHFSEQRELSPKEFLLEKQPKTDVERVTCLAYYLSNYRDTPHFKTIDISKLNTEAAQRKFSNAAKAVDNAARSGFLVQAPKKGHKQLSAGAELFVQALPDREEAKEALAHCKPRNKKSATKKKQK